LAGTTVRRTDSGGLSETGRQAQAGPVGSR